jgi:hypothetical protein
MDDIIAYICIVEVITCHFFQSHTMYSVHLVNVNDKLGVNNEKKININFIHFRHL